VAYSAYLQPLGVVLGIALLPVWGCSPTGVYPSGDQNQPYGGAGGDSSVGGGGPGGAGNAGGGGPGGGGPGGGGPGGVGAGGPGGATGQGGVGGDNPGGVGGDSGAAGGFGGVAGDNSFGGAGALPPFDGGTDPGRNRVPAGQVCERLATVQCAAEVACCGNPGHTFDQCKAAQKAGCVNDGHLDEVTLNPVAGYNIDRAEVAFAEFERLASMCDPGVVEWAIGANGLRGIVLGTVDRGGSCKPPVGQSSNPPVAAAHLASCKDAANTACRPINLTQWTCEARGPAGAPCLSDLNCVDGIYCDNPELMPTGAVCKPRKPDGQGCATPNECASLFCQGGRCVPPSVGAAYCLTL
jgi:Dickkopf-like protein